MDTAIVIPAIKKSVAFTDDLVKKLDGVTLIQRAINKAFMFVSRPHIYVVTDSEEICLICQRNSINFNYQRNIKLEPGQFAESLLVLFPQFSTEYKEVILLSPYAPLLQEKDLRQALNKFRAQKNKKLLIPVKKQVSRIFKEGNRDFRQLLSGDSNHELLVESQAFKIINASLLGNGFEMEQVVPQTYEITSDLIEIKSYQDWWVCEKLIRRKRIVFRMIGDEKIGMGHIYRSLALAHEITDHEVYFVCDEKSRRAVTRIAGSDYWLGVYQEDEIESRILDLKPNLVINDILNTSKDYVLRLRDKGIHVVNFEDLGSGARHTDLTINELYDVPLKAGKNFLWGQKYFFLREEFWEARPNRFKQKVEAILVTFGAADPSDFTRKIFRVILPYCARNKIKIFLVTGGGYSCIKKLEKEVQRIKEVEVEYIHVTGVMSHIMEQVQISIAANGRTPYELAHMNIPSIILSHHERELAHPFASRERGFIPVGLYEGEKTDKKVLASLKRMVEVNDYRRNLFLRMRPYRFSKNKDKVLGLIYAVLEK